MAGPRACYNPCWNPPLTGEEELAGAAPTESSKIPTLTLAVSRAITSAPTIALSSDNKLFKQFIKAYLEAHVLGQIEVDSEPRKQLLKARFADFYYSILRMDCYQFCQQCKDHFKTAGAKRPNKNLFAALFLYRSVIQQWLKHKQRYDGAMPLNWVKFKDLLQKNLGDSRAFVDSIW